MLRRYLFSPSRQQACQYSSDSRSASKHSTVSCPQAWHVWSVLSSTAALRSQAYLLQSLPLTMTAAAGWRPNRVLPSSLQSESGYCGNRAQASNIKYCRLSDGAQHKTTCAAQPGASLVLPRLAAATWPQQHTVQQGLRSLVTLLQTGSACSAVFSGQAGFATASKQTRKIPKGYTMPANQLMQRSIKPAFTSPNVLADPYKLEKRLPFLHSWLTPAGWQARWLRIKSMLRDAATIAQCMKHIKGFKLRTFKTEALKTYEDTCKALATGNQNILRNLVTPAELTNMKREIKRREDAGWKRVEWALAQPVPLHRCSVVRGRLVVRDMKNIGEGFAQMTLRISSKQRFAVYSREGQLLTGNPEEDIDVEDHFVFERHLKGPPNDHWRVAARLAITPPKP